MSVHDREYCVFLYGSAQAFVLCGAFAWWEHGDAVLGLAFAQMGLMQAAVAYFAPRRSSAAMTDRIAALLAGVVVGPLLALAVVFACSVRW